MTDFMQRVSLAMAKRKETAIQAVVDKHLYPKCPADGEILWMLMQATGISIVVEHSYKGGSTVAARRGGIVIDRIPV